MLNGANGAVVVVGETDGEVEKTKMKRLLMDNGTRVNIESK